MVDSCCCDDYCFFNLHFPTLSHVLEKVLLLGDVFSAFNDVEREVYNPKIIKDNLRFRVTFDISNINDFVLDDYVIRINMGSLRSNIPFELDRVKIDLH